MASRGPLPPRQTERQWQGQVIELAQLYGWRVAHFRPAQTARGWRTPVEADGQGFPDLTMARGSRLLFAELKADRGRTSPDQDKWLQALRFTSAEVYVWRPRDWTDVCRVLRP
jgi:hypothetical protein